MRFGDFSVQSCFSCFQVAKEHSLDCAWDLEQFGYEELKVSAKLELFKVCIILCDLMKVKNDHIFLIVYFWVLFFFGFHINFTSLCDLIKHIIEDSLQLLGLATYLERRHIIFMLLQICICTIKRKNMDKESYMQVVI